MLRGRRLGGGEWDLRSFILPWSGFLLRIAHICGEVKLLEVFIWFLRFSARSS